MITSIDCVAEQVRTRGFATVSNVLTTDKATELATLLERSIHDDITRFGVDGPDYCMVLNLMARHVEFARLMENDILHKHLTQLLGDTCIIYAYTSSSMPPHNGNYSCRVHVDCPRVIPGYITNIGIMIALTDFTEENGATWFMPNSCEREALPTEEHFFTSAVRVFPKAGDAVFFNARTVHMGGRNRTDTPRHALTMNVCRSFMRQRFDYPRLVPQEIVNQLGETGRRFLGYNVRMPTSLDEYYVPEQQRLYKANQG